MDRLLTQDRLRVYPRMGVAALLLQWVVTAWARGWIGGDYIAFYSGARFVLERPGASPYLTPEFVEFQSHILPLDGRIGPWFNPPTALLLYTPFAQVSFWPSLALWLAFGVTCWLLGLHVLRRALDDPRPPSAWLGTSLLFTPTLLWFIYGQATPVAFLVLAASCAALLRGREAAAGALLGLLAFKPQLALGLALPLVFALRWRALLAGAVTVGLQVALTAVIWPEQLGHFARALGPIRDTLFLPGEIGTGIHTIHSFWWLLLGDLSTTASEALSLATGGAVVLLLAVGWRRVPWDVRAEPWRRALAASLVAGLTLGVHLFTYDLALLLLPFFLLTGLERHGQDQRAEIVRLAAVVWVLAFLGSHFTGFVDLFTSRVLGVHVAVQLTPVALLYAAWRIWPREVARP